MRRDEEPIPPETFEAALGGDPRAVRVLVAVLRPVIQSEIAATLARSRGRARGRSLAQDVDDFVQEVFANLFADDAKELRRWRPELSPLTAFVRGVAFCDAISILRSRTRSPYTEDPVEPEAFDPVPRSEPSPERLALERTFLVQIVEAVRAELGARGAAVFELLVLRERPVSEVCHTLQMSEDAVYAWRSRIGKLARQIRDQLQSA